MIDQDRIAELNAAACSPHHDRDLAELVARLGRGGRTDPDAVVAALAELRWRRPVVGGRDRGNPVRPVPGRRRAPHDGGEDRRRRGAPTR